MGGSPPAIVVADDVAAIRHLVRATLEPAGFLIVGEAADGAEAVAQVVELQPDAILLDLNMPGRDGLQAITDIRTHAPGVKICVLTGLAEQVIADKAYELGAHAFLEKGSALDELADVLRGLLAQ